MKLRTGLRRALVAATLGALAVTGVAACGVLSSPSAQAATLTPEASALTALGFSDQELVPASDPSPAPSASAAKHPRRMLLRRELAGRVEHGEVVVKTKTGDETIDVQRGTVTAISSTSVTVKSSDGFTLTWTLGTPIRVIENRTSVQPSAVTTGLEVGVAGVKSGGTVTARLILIPHGK